MRKFIDFVCSNNTCDYSKKSIELFVLDSNDKMCTSCGGVLKRQYSAKVMLNLKGNGFYKNGLQ